MGKVYTAEEFAKEYNIDTKKIEADKKKEAVEAKTKRVAEAKKKPGYMEPSGSTDKSE